MLTWLLPYIPFKNLPINKLDRQCTQNVNNEARFGVRETTVSVKKQ